MAKTFFAKDQKYGDWTLKLPFAGGGNSFVWEAENSKGERKIIKLLKKDGDLARTRFAEEITIMKTNIHIDGVMKILDASELTPETKDYWYVMNEGVTLEKHLAKADPIDIVSAVAEIANILTILHAKGVSHRDIKPQNLYYIDDRITIGDFGLVDYPTRMRGLTIRSQQLGPTWTLAPEMRRNPQTADGKKADVYSLAKTLWILLTGVEKGFDGQYSPQGSVGISNYHSTIDNSYLDNLLVEATENDPRKRPTMDEFEEGLQEWVDMMKDFYAKNKIDWIELQAKLFPTSMPEHVVWTKINDIISVLNVLSGINGLTHMFMPDSGGMDIKSAKLAQEDGLMELDLNGLIYYLKPKSLTFESFGGDPEWNYFRLECEEIKPLKDSSRESSQQVTEKSPGEYGPYGEKENYYDEHGHYPEGWRNVTRYFKGSFVIFQKTSTYNYTSQTYDGRHNTVSPSAFRDYIQRVADSGYKIYKVIDGDKPGLYVRGKMLDL
ncbi:protein kinase domain-containing protein [Mucilaginibacter sp.]